MNGVSTDFQEEQVIEITESKVIYNVIKRIFDIILSFISIILLSPLFLLISVLIKLDSKGKVFYKHKRIGKNGEYIYLYKFRSMYSDSKERLEDKVNDNRYDLAEFLPDAQTVFNKIVPNYVAGFIYGALMESYCSEHNSRMMAMQTATDAATDMIKQLDIMYNRARQAAITQEITEVIAGSKAQKNKS